MTNLIIEGLKDYLHKSLDTSLGLFGTGVMISIANDDGSVFTTQAEWGVLISGVATGVLMVIRAVIIIRTHLRKSRMEEEEHRLKMKKG